jgi:hypothetical protein
MRWLIQGTGAVLVLLVLIDIYLTVLYQSGNGLFSMPLNHAVWRLCRRVALLIPASRDRLLSFVGSMLLVLIVVLWGSLLVCGFALVVWPALGTAIQASQGPTPTNFATALYYSGYALTTLGTGDIVPKTSLYRLLLVLESFIGFSVLTLTITYFLSVYNALVRRNAFALRLQHGTGGTADAVELLAHLGAGGNFGNSRQDISNMASELLHLLQWHHSYAILPFFRFVEGYYALPRIALIAMDTATLIKSALDEEQHRSVMGSAAVAELWGGGLQLLTRLSKSLLPGSGRSEVDQPEQSDVDHWRARFYEAVAHLQMAGIATVPDVAAGADRYVALRCEWNPYVVTLAKYLAYEWSIVDLTYTDHLSALSRKENT